MELAAFLCARLRILVLPWQSSNPERGRQFLRCAEWRRVQVGAPGCAHCSFLCSGVFGVQESLGHVRPFPGPGTGDLGTAAGWGPGAPALLGPVSRQGAGLSPGRATRALTSPPSLQQARDLREALELFVKPDLLGGENSYLCAGCVWGCGQERGCGCAGGKRAESRSTGGLLDLIHAKA